MPPQLLPREEVVDRLMTVVRRLGYDGASLAELSRATGLGKSSLYHYFPKGKEDMVLAVLDQLGAYLRDGLFQPLRQEGDPAQRVRTMLKTLDAFYRGGRESCVLGNLVIGENRRRFQKPLRALFTEWIEALAVALVDAGLPRAVARARAEDAVLRIEGALVVASGLDDVAVFARVLKVLGTELLAPAR